MLWNVQKENSERNKTIMINQFQIILPVYQQSNILNLCMKSLINTIKMPTRIILINDNSPKETVAVIENNTTMNNNLVDFVIINHKKSIGYNKSVNEGIDLIEDGGYVVFADSDVIFCEDWQSKAINTLESDTTIGGVGGVLLYPQTSGIQNCGIGYMNYLGRHLFLNNKIDYIKKMKNFKVQSSVFAFFVTKSSIVKRVGNMNEQYFNGYEDVDYQMKIRRLGYNIFINTDIVLYHWEKSNGVHRSFSRRQNLGRFWADNNDIIKDDMLDFFQLQMDNYIKTNKAYIGIDLCESRHDAEKVWSALEKKTLLEHIQDYSSECSINDKIWLPQLLSSETFRIQTPIIFMCDNFVQLTENYYWFNLRSQYCTDDIIIDMYANILRMKDLSDYFWPGNKIR